MQVEERTARRSPEQFDYYLSAFLSAARSVAYKVRFAFDEDWNVIDDWKATRGTDDGEFFDAMTKLRDAEVHNEGATVSTTQERVPAPLLEPRNERFFAYYAAWFSTGMLGSTEVYIDRHWVNLEDTALEAVKAGQRLVELLDDLLRYVAGLTKEEQTP